MICVCIGTIVRLEIRYNGLKDSASDLKTQIAECKDDIEQLSEQLNEELDDEYVIKIAREKLNYCMPDEIIYYDISGK